MSLERGYEEIKTPLLYDAELWKISGHWDKYREHMFVTESEDKPMGLKPMNCPGHCAFYAMGKHSYRELPIRYAEPGLLHRNEPSGTLHGLLRVRHFIQDDAHIFCTDDQIEAGGPGLPRVRLRLVRHVRLRHAHRALDAARAADRHRRDTGTAPRPRSRRRSSTAATTTTSTRATAPSTARRSTSTCATRSTARGSSAPCSSTYTFPERFDLTYTGADNAEHQPAMIHRALVGSFERFIGILLEHTGGELPLWLAPAQAAVLPLADRHNGYAAEVAAALRAGGLRAEVDDRTESVGRKIREAELRKVPYMLVVGDREAEERAVSLRRHGEGDLGTVGLDAPSSASRARPLAKAAIEAILPNVDQAFPHSSAAPSLTPRRTEKR